MLRADGTEMSASPGAESCMQDEGGYVFLRLAIFVERDIISQCGFYTAPEIPGSIVSAMSAIAAAAEGKAIMAAALINSKSLKSALSELNLSNSELKKSADIAALMLHECLRNYSIKYNQARQTRLSKAKANSEKAIKNTSSRHTILRGVPGTFLFRFYLLFTHFEPCNLHSAFILDYYSEKFSANPEILF